MTRKTLLRLVVAMFSICFVVSKSTAQTFGTLLHNGTYEGSAGSITPDSFDVPDGIDTLTFKFSISTGSALASVGVGTFPQPGTGFEGKNYSTDSYVIIDNITAGTYYMTIYGQSSYSGASLQIRGFTSTDAILFADDANNLLLNIEHLQQSDSRWGTMLIDHINNTLSRRGCAVTVLAMALNYASYGYGNNISYDPESLNAIAEQNLQNGGNDFVGDANINWGPATKDASSSELYYIAATPISSNSDPAGAEAYLDEHVVQDLEPVIVRVYPYPTISNNMHFVLVVGKEDGRFLIADPSPETIFHNKSYLDQYTNGYELRGVVRNSSGTQHTNKVNPAKMFVENIATSEPIASDGQGLFISSDDSVDLQVVDSSSRVTGTDFTSESYVENIPNSSAFTDSVGDAETGEPSNTATHFIYIYGAEAGQYKINTKGAKSGSYTITVDTIAADGTKLSQTLHGSTTVGQLSTNNVSVGGITNSPNVSISQFKPVAYEAGLKSAVVIVARDGDMSQDLNVSYSVKGSAKAGIQYKPLAGIVKIPAGLASAKIRIKPLDDGMPAKNSVVKIILTPSDSYTIVNPSLVKIEVVGN